MESSSFMRARDDPGSTLPSILEDETIYSWCATSHAMSCSASAAETGRRMLGAAHAVRQHDLPASLGSVPLLQEADATAAVECLREHTIAGYYLPFMPYERQLSVGEAVCSGRQSHWRRHVSGVSRTHPTDHPLKWCRLCAQADAETVGRAYWHADLQFPTTWVCRIHMVPLSVSPGRSKRWLLPQGSRQSPAAISLDEPAAAMLASVGAALRHVSSVDVRSLRQAVILRMRDIGVIHSAGGARHARIAKWFASTGVSSVCGTTQIKLTHLSGGDWIPELLWRKKLAHAAGWVALWSSLEWDSPETSVKSFEDAVSGERPSDGAQLLLFDSGTQQSRRAPTRVQDAFANSDSYDEVMARLLVSRADVVRWLEQDPELRADWRQRLKQGKQLQCTSRIRSLASSVPEMTRQQLESTCGAEIKWLREHAPSILSAMLKSIPPRASAQGRIFLKL